MTTSWLRRLLMPSNEQDNGRSSQPKVKTCLSGPLLIVLAFGAIGVIGSRAAEAHHSFAMFDMSREIKVVGTVTAFEYTNPHSWTRVQVTDESGANVEWRFEGFGPGSLQRYGWHRNTLKVGDKITVFTRPMRNGKPAGTFERAILPDGRVVHQIDLIPSNPGFKQENIAEQMKDADSESKRVKN